MITSSFDRHQQQILQERLQVLQGREAVLSYHQLQGFLFAIACSPEPIKPSEWFDLIWLDDEPQFENEDEARSFFRLVVALADHIANMTRQRRFLPFSARYSERWRVELGEWCDGLLLGHHYLEDLWMIAMDDVNDQALIDDIEASLGLATTFSDLNDTSQLSFGDSMELGDQYLAEAYGMFWKVLSTYATLGSIWSDGEWDYNTEQLFLALEPVGHDDICPCGSGEVFAKCCLH